VLDSRLGSLYSIIFSQALIPQFSIAGLNFGVQRRPNLSAVPIEPKFRLSIYDTTGQAKSNFLQKPQKFLLRQA